MGHYLSELTDGKCQSEPAKPGSLKRVVRRAAAKTLSRLKRETVLRPIGSICYEEWQECRDIIAEEMTEAIKRVVKQSTPNRPSSLTAADQDYECKPNSR